MIFMNYWALLMVFLCRLAACLTHLRHSDQNKDIHHLNIVFIGIRSLHQSSMPHADAYADVKSVQSALSDLLTTSATHGTFSRPSTKCGLILIGLGLNTNAKEPFADHVH